MKILWYYRITDPAVCSAARGHFDTVNALRLEQNKFARRFGGYAFHSALDERFVGVGFAKPPKNPELWSKPDKYGVQRPKVAAKGPLADALRAEWTKHYPNGSMPRNLLLDALGVPEIMPGRSLEYALVKGVVYVAISNTLAFDEEITASAYYSAVNNAKR